ncbi:hypothetical protein LPJ75_001476 [Coemansia sp. RSA 2598]|nr:hypothetical protein LPJ75_001476 [Coemansia sp. RSA 2598]
MLVICTIITTALTYQTVIHHVVRNYLVIRWARVTSTMMELTACQLSLMILLFTPCFNCMFNRTRYQKQWYEKMRSDGMTARYGFDTETFSQQLRQQEHQQLSSTLVSNTSSV